VVLGFYEVVVKWGNVLFFAFHAMRWGFGFFWHCVEECDWAMRGMGLWFFCLFFSLILFWLVLCFLYCLYLFVFGINCVIGLLALPLCGANANRPLTIQGKAKEPDQGKAKAKTTGQQTTKPSFDQTNKKQRVSPPLRSKEQEAVNTVSDKPIAASERVKEQPP
jgi:hypothetical protein